jgi:hypothetical protein
MTWRLRNSLRNMSQYAGHMADLSMRTASGSPERVSSRATAAPSARPLAQNSDAPAVKREAKEDWGQ